MFRFPILLAMGIFFWIWPGFSYAQPLRFFSEDLSFRVEEGCFHVSGTYHLRQEGPCHGPVPLIYPFPVEGYFAPVDSFSIFHFQTGQPIQPVKVSAEGLSILVPCDSLVSLLISYRQPMLGDTARYILLTTNLWGKPLEDVVYRFEAPPGRKPLFFSYPYDSYELIGGREVYGWRRKNFRPDRDWIVVLGKE